MIINSSKGPVRKQKTKFIKKDICLNCFNFSNFYLTEYTQDYDKWSKVVCEVCEFEDK